jgi:hypothetical protein
MTKRSIGLGAAVLVLASIMFVMMFDQPESIPEKFEIKLGAETFIIDRDLLSPTSQRKGSIQRAIGLDIYPNGTCTDSISGRSSLTDGPLFVTVESRFDYKKWRDGFSTQIIEDIQATPRIGWNHIQVEPRRIVDSKGVEKIDSLATTDYFFQYTGETYDPFAFCREDDSYPRKMDCMVFFSFYGMQAITLLSSKKVEEVTPVMEYVACRIKNGIQTK